MASSGAGISGSTLAARCQENHPRLLHFQTHERRVIPPFSSPFVFITSMSGEFLLSFLSVRIPFAYHFPFPLKILLKALNRRHFVPSSKLKIAIFSLFFWLVQKKSLPLRCKGQSITFPSLPDVKQEDIH